MKYVYLLLAIIFEVFATSSLQASQQFTKLVPSILVVIGYGFAFFFLSQCLRTMELGIAYALWSGLGIVLISAIGVVVYKQSLDLPAILGMALILGGVVVINVFSKTAVH
jgi:small multidrug resistance pump